MIKEEEIVGIIQKKLEGNLASEESSRLNLWLKVPANKEAYAQYELLWDNTTSVASKQENYTPNTSKAWQAIEQEISAAEPKRRFKIAHAVAASAALLVILLGGNYIFNISNTSENIQYVLEANEKDTLTLNDGSLAYLFGPCSISYPAEFDANERIISMDGFAYFDIVHDPSHPFEINTEKGKVEVLGTSFTIDTRQKETFTVQCITGKVRMTAAHKGSTMETILTKNKKATYSTTSQQLKPISFETRDLNIAIPVRNMAFNNKPLGEILERIEYNYGVSIQLENESLLDTKYSTSLNDTTIDDFFNELKITFKVEVIQTKPSTYILKGGNLN